MKTRSTFFRNEMMKKIRNNADGTELKQSILDSAEKWKQMSNDQLWESMFGSELKRSHMVLSYGWCPICKETVGRGTWICDPYNKPWKVFCPSCGEAFPKNDFEKFYKSGLDEHHIFRYELADRSLLYNEEAPDLKDERHLLYVDDGTGSKVFPDILICCIPVFGNKVSHIVDFLMHLQEFLICLAVFLYCC
jgi:hypothetical protein